MTEYKLSRGNLKKRHDGDWYLSLTVVGWLQAQVCCFHDIQSKQQIKRDESSIKRCETPQKSQESIACSFHEQSWFPACPWHTDNDIEKYNFNC
jgi:hypothetical protein